jgi:hypothetical protein
VILASEHHAPPDETCKLISVFAESERKMIGYVEPTSRNAASRLRSASS